jgi:hypothetical protein
MEEKHGAPSGGQTKKNGVAEVFSTTTATPRATTGNFRCNPPAPNAKNASSRREQVFVCLKWLSQIFAGLVKAAHYFSCG